MSASSVPLVAESVDLVGELGEVLVGAALVVLDDPQQALAGIEQATAPSAPMAHCSPL